jgi:hypothetical protein
MRRFPATAAARLLLLLGVTSQAALAFVLRVGPLDTRWCCPRAAAATTTSPRLFEASLNHSDPKEEALEDVVASEPATATATTTSGTTKWADNNSTNNNSTQSSLQLLIGTADEVQHQMSQFRSKYPTAESDYLAAARARSTARVPSKSHNSVSDEEWKTMAEQKRREYGETGTDGWEESAQEVGNRKDSLILIPMPNPDDDNDEVEPKLLLF